MSTSHICRIASLDHLVLTVADLSKTLAFYQSLGLAHQSFTPDTRGGGGDGKPRHSLHYGQSKINIHERGKEFEPKAENVQPGSADLCFIIEDKVNDVLERLKAAGVEVLEGGQVVKRTGAVGDLRSVYIRDPDGNLIELSNYV